jgi:hypothetical protein
VFRRSFSAHRHADAGLVALFKGCNDQVRAAALQRDFGVYLQIKNELPHVRHCKEQMKELGDCLQIISESSQMH